MTGMDLTDVDGLEASTVLTVISEIGFDMSRWPTEKHFTSWLTLCPGVNKSGGRSRSKSGRTLPGSSRAAAALRMSASSLMRSDCALGAYARRMRARLGAPKAITATARKLAVIIYNMLKYGKVYVDRGAQYYEEQYRAAMLKNLKRRAKQLGYELVETASPYELEKAAPQS
jgi:transposase